jgi:hypothetical protein
MTGTSSRQWEEPRHELESQVFVLITVASVDEAYVLAPAWASLLEAWSSELEGVSSGAMTLFCRCVRHTPQQ